MTKVSGPNRKEQVVVENGYEIQRLKAESYAEFEYRPHACRKTYRMIFVRNEIDVTRGQQFLFNKERYFSYISNEAAEDVPAREVIHGCNDRCDQENTISQRKASGALSALLDTLKSNRAYMAFGSLALDAETMERDARSCRKKRRPASCASRRWDADHSDGVRDFPELADADPKPSDSNSASANVSVVDLSLIGGLADDGSTYNSTHKTGTPERCPLRLAQPRKIVGQSTDRRLIEG